MSETATATRSRAEVALPTTLTQVGKLTRYQFRDYLRSRRFVLMMGLVAMIGGILSAVVGYYRPHAFVSDPLAFYGTLWGGGSIFIIILAAVIYGGDAIAGEFQNKTGYFLMGLPIRRATVYVGKYIAAFLASLAALSFYALILMANGAYYFGGGFAPWQLGESYLLAIAYLLAVLGAALMFSSLFKTSTYATLLVAVLFLFGFTLLQDLVSGLANIRPWFIISYADTIIGAVFASDCTSQPGAHTCVLGTGPGGRAISVSVNNATIPEGVAIMLAYFVITAIIGLVLFEREEFT